MQFEKQVIFLGMVPNSLRDGGTYYTITLFDQKAGPVQVNVKESNHEVVLPLLDCSFGVPLDVVFVLRPKDKLYRLTLVSVRV